MPNRSGPDRELSPAALEVLKDIEVETEKLRELDLDDTPPAAVYDAGKP